jgi:FAM192A/Fyv6, N-terminal domain
MLLVEKRRKKAFVPHENSTMSLSFVSTSIQTVKEDGEFEEIEVENPTEMTGSASLRASSGLFDQLRKNQDQDEAEREELQRSMTRGTLALDEDDAAHLNHLDSVERKKRSEMQTETKLALEDFRMAQSERPRKVTKTTLDGGGVKKDEAPSLESSFDNKKKILPALIVKKRRRRDADEAIDKKSRSTNKDESTDSAADLLVPAVDPSKPPSISQGTSISSLLGGYSSSSEDEA